MMAMISSFILPEITCSDAYLGRAARGGRHGSSEEFLATFGRVVGEMGTRRRDLPEQELYDIVSGKKWAEGGLVPQ
ncbi:hypothetical protein TeGR_g628 [Tetraparma gracilis]|uniref:Uncharacterized protein n=1 Tax=Tetraparma gracilis TaxID=2962635 RepID=A0ABQ6ND40_9STRA|nr:hypothetical protein TeGR_g628 [Tetraparma gracilis]